MNKQILFCYKVIKFMQFKFGTVEFEDDFLKNQCPDFTFQYAGNLYIVEIKSERESLHHPGYAGISFNQFRQRLKNLTVPSRKKTEITKWILYCYQLYDYSINTAWFNNLSLPVNPILCLAFPRNHLPEIIDTWNYLHNSFNCAKPTLQYLSDKKENISIILIRKNVLANIFALIP